MMMVAATALNAVPTTMAAASIFRKSPSTAIALPVGCCFFQNARMIFPLVVDGADAQSRLAGLIWRGNRGGNRHRLASNAGANVATL